MAAVISGPRAELGTSLRLDGWPVPVLAAAACGGDCLLVIDQLDALSLASGRLPLRFNHIAELFDEVAVVDGEALLRRRPLWKWNEHR